MRPMRPANNMGRSINRSHPERLPPSPSVAHCETMAMLHKASGATGVMQARSMHSSLPRPILVSRARAACIVQHDASHICRAAQQAEANVAEQAQESQVGRTLGPFCLPASPVALACPDCG